MKIRCTFKDPDTMQDAVDEETQRFVRKLVEGMEQPLTKAAIDAELEERAAEAKEHIDRKWMEYGEYITVEFDTTAGTATVIHR